MSNQQYKQRRKEDMSWLHGLLFLAACGIAFYLWRKHGAKVASNSLPQEEEMYAELWTVLEEAVASYRKKQLAYAIHQEVLAGNFPDSILPSLEARYGKSEGCPYLSLPEEWRSKSADGIRAWMRRKNLPFTDGLRVLHELEKLLEERLHQEAKTILEQAVKRE